MDFNLENIYDNLKKNFGFTSKQAKIFFNRLVFKKNNFYENFIKQVNEIVTLYKPCLNCNFIKTNDFCFSCNKVQRNQTKVCIVENSIDVFNIDKLNVYDGTFFVLNNLFKTRQTFEERKKLETLINLLILKIKKNKSYKEIIIALNTTQSGLLTTNYLISKLKKINFTQITVLARGIPIGTFLEYLDEETLKQSLKNRKLI